MTTRVKNAFKISAIFIAKILHWLPISKENGHPKIVNKYVKDTKKSDLIPIRKKLIIFYEES